MSKINQKTLQKLLSYGVLLAFILNFLGEITFGIFRIGFLDELGSMLILSLAGFVIIAKQRIRIHNPLFIIYFLLLSIIYFLFYIQTLPSFLYEYYKLFVFLIFIPLLNYTDEFTIEKTIDRLTKLFAIVLLVNLIFIVLQYITNNEILRILHYDVKRTDSWVRYGRYTGLFDVANLGLTALLVLLFNEIFNKNNKYYYLLFGLCLVSLILSSSKVGYLIFLIWAIVYSYKYLIRHGLKIIISLIIFSSFAFIYTKETIYTKVEQYGYFFKHIGNVQKLNLATVEKRAMFLGESIKIVKEHPFGLGFGTFGDASAKLNPDAYQMPRKYWLDKYVYMSDSSFAHILAEQGITSIFYYLLFFLPILFLKRKLLKFYVLLLLFYFLQHLVTMSLTSGSYPMLFALLFGLFYFNKKYENIFKIS